MRDFGQPMGMKKEGTQAHKAAGMWSNKNLDTSFSLSATNPSCILSTQHQEWTANEQAGGD